MARLARLENPSIRIDREHLLRQTIVPESEIDIDADRRGILRELFGRVTAGKTDRERVEAWVRYLQGRIAHPAFPPMHNDTVMVTDPLWILEHGLGQCGQTNRVLVDGLLAANIRARIVQLAAHVAAEAFYDSGWHYLDADWLGCGQFVRKPDGTIPSTAEIVRRPAYLETVEAGREFDSYPAAVTHPETAQPYEAMFRRVRLGRYRTPFYLTKIATPAQERDLTFGWNYCRVETR